MRFTGTVTRRGWWGTGGAGACGPESCSGHKRRRMVINQTLTLSEDRLFYTSLQKDPPKTFRKRVNTIGTLLYEGPRSLETTPTCVEDLDAVASSFGSLTWFCSFPPPAPSGRLECRIKVTVVSEYNYSLFAETNNTRSLCAIPSVCLYVSTCINRTSDLK